MAEHPILFSGPMIQAIRDGRKTQTRRVIKMCHRAGCPWAFDENDDTGYEWVEAEPELSGHDYSQPCRCIQCPYGVPGDTLWVRETWCTHRAWNNDPPRNIPKGEFILYAESHEGEMFWGGGTQEELARFGKTRPSIHMPRWASRIRLRLTEVRVQQVQEITPEDARAEGITHPPETLVIRDTTDIQAFVKLWDSINTARGHGWNVDPWIWALTFEIAR